MINPEESQVHNTGRLSVDKNGRVRRSLLFATYNSGVAQMLDTPQNRDFEASPTTALPAPP